MIELDEVFFANGNVIAEEGDPKYIWKTVLSPGRLELTPGPGGKRVKKPLVIIEGHSDDPTKEIGLADLLDSFEQGAIQHVTIPVSHDNKVLENTGFIRHMRMAQENGKNVLQAAFEFTEPEVHEKVKRGSIADVSCGILRNYERQRDGESFKAVVDHIALTNRPWIDGMAPFFKLSDDSDLTPEGFYFSDLDLAVYQDHTSGARQDYLAKGAEDISNSNTTDTVPWDTSMSMVTRQRLLEDALDAQYPNCMLVDFTTSKALLNEDNGTYYVAGYGLKDDGSVSIHPQAEWGVYTPSVDDDFLSEDHKTSKGGDNPVDELQLAEFNAKIAEAEAKATAAEERARQSEAKVAEAEKKERVNAAKERVRELGALGLSAYPGFLNMVEQIMLSDDGDVALNLSEDDETKHLTATDVVERLIDAFPKDEEGNIQLSQQHIKIDDEDDNPGLDKEKTVEERAADLRDFLQLDNKKLVLS